MPAGQTPHTVVLFAHNDLVDKVQPGDRVNVTGKNVGCIDAIILLLMTTFSQFLDFVMNSLAWGNVLPPASFRA